MSYNTLNQCANDPAFVKRVQACIAQEAVARSEDVDPVQSADGLRWKVAAATDVEQAYAFAVAQSNPNPGGDPTVCTDAMILSHVQGNWTNVAVR